MQPAAQPAVLVTDGRHNIVLIAADEMLPDFPLLLPLLLLLLLLLRFHDASSMRRSREKKRRVF